MNYTYGKQSEEIDEMCMINQFSLYISFINFTNELLTNELLISTFCLKLWKLAPFFQRFESIYTFFFKKFHKKSKNTVFPYTLLFRTKIRKAAN